MIYRAIYEKMDLVFCSFKVLISHFNKNRTAPLNDISMYNITYLTMYKEQMHTGAIRKLVYGRAYMYGR